MKVLDRVLRAGDGKRVKALQGLVPDINALAQAMSALSDEALRGKTAEFRSRIERGEDTDDLLVEAFAVVREASLRVIGQRHYDVQMMGGAALHAGWISEMRTGEGKTLVATLAEGRIAGAGLDVYEFEPEVTEELLELENVVLTPHIASATRETRLAMGMLCVEALRAVLLEGRAPPNAV